MRRPQKLYTPEDVNLNRQIEELCKPPKYVTVTFAAANTTTKADVGFKADRYFPVNKTANISVWHTDADDRYLYLQASAAGTVILQVWREA